MSSGFVKEGAPAERDAAWLAAEQELEATRRRKAEQARQSDGRGLYETLQANKGITASTPAIFSLFMIWLITQVCPDDQLQKRKHLQRPQS